MEITDTTPRYSLHMMLCGYFSTAPASERGRLDSDASWKEIVLPEKSPHPHADSKETYRSFYYPEFVRFCFDDCRRWEYAMEKLSSTLDFRGVAIPFEVDGISIVEYPNDIAMVAVSVRCTSGSINDFTALGFRLREPSGDGDGPAAYHEKVVAPILHAMAALTGRAEVPASAMVELGNKMKVFQIVESAREMPQEEAENMLFALGTLSRYEPGKDASGFSSTYRKTLINESRISVFQNWTALSLFDTFTMLGSRLPEWQPAMWVSDYFFMLYLYAVYYKFYLQRLNMRFYTDPRKVEALTEEYDNFEIGCNFTYLSYNFLPNELAAAMMKSLDIERERQKVTSTLMRESKRVESMNDTRLNRFLTFLTVLTVFSTIWDFSSLLEKITGFETSMGPRGGYGLVASLILSVVVLCILLIIRSTRKR